MNTNYMTIADALAGPAGFVPASPRQETARRTMSYSNVGDEKRLQSDSNQPVMTDNRRIDSQSNPVEKVSKEFRQALREKEDSGNLPRTQNNTRSQERPADSKTQDKPELVQNWLAQNAVPVENAKVNSTTKNEFKSGQKLAELLGNIKREKPMPATGQAAKAVEIKLLDPGQKVQAGLKTVLPEKSQGLNGLRVFYNGSNRSVLSIKTWSDDGDSMGKKLSAASKTSIANSLPNIVQPKAPDLEHQPVATASRKSVHANEVKASFQSSGGERATKSLSVQIKGQNHTSEDAVSNPSFSKKNTAGARQDIGQPKHDAAASGKSSLYQETTPTVPQSVEQTQTRTSSFSAFGVNTMSPNISQGSLSAGILTDVSRQILEFIHTSISQQATEKEVNVRLNPPELGQVLIKLKEQDTQISGVLEVSKAQTKLEIEQALPEIIRNLATSGIQVNRIEVVFSVSEHTAENDSQDALLNDSLFQQQSSLDYDSRKNDFETDDVYKGSSNDVAYRNTGGFEDMSLSDNSINLLI